MFIIPNDFYEIRSTKDRGRGVFALKEILGGTVIGDYVGKLVTSGSIHEESSLFYSMWYNDSTDIYPDLTTEGVHLVNHACESNCDIDSYKRHNILFAVRRIYPGEELTFQYGIDPPEFNEKEGYPCKCGSRFCKGTMHTSPSSANEWEAYVESLYGASLAETEVPVGTMLPRLDKYPDSIPDNDRYDIWGYTNAKPERVDAAKLSSRAEIRRMIRESGATLVFPNLNICVLGVQRCAIVADILK